MANSLHAMLLAEIDAVVVRPSVPEATQKCQAPALLPPSASMRELVATAGLVEGASKGDTHAEIPSKRSEVLSG